MQALVLELRRATIRRAESRLFAGTTWSIRAGEHWAVVGPNGSGKSTLLRALWGGFPLCAGELDYTFERTAYFRRHFYFSIPEEAVAHVGYAEQRECIRQHLNFLQERWYSGAEHGAPNVAEFLSWEAIRGITPFQVDAQPPDLVRYHGWRRRAIHILGLQPLLPQPVHLLSNGEWRKVLMARALMQSPAVLVLDDPFAGLDALSRERLQRHLTRLFRGRMPVVMALSQVDQIPPGITHVLVVQHQKMILQGRWPAVKRKPEWGRVFPDRAPDKASLADAGSRHRAVAGPHEAPAPILECRHVSLMLSGKQIIHNLDWTVRAGEQWALVGPNGAGKSSLAGLIAGDIPQAYAQDIRLFGRPRGSGETIWQIKHQIGFYSPELLAQFPDHLTVQAVVLSGFFDTLGIFRRCSTPQRRSALRWLKQLKLSGVRHRLFCELSEGEQRLVLVARALVKESALLILDEPFQNLDAAHRARLRCALEHVATTGTAALILIVHRPLDLPGTITHWLRLKAGRVQYNGCVSTD